MMTCVFQNRFIHQKNSTFIKFLCDLRRVLLDLLVLLVRMVCLAFLDPLDLPDLVDVLERWDLL